MEHGFIKAAAVTPKIRVADPVYNGAVVRDELDKACEKGAKIIVYPELCLTGYTCEDLFLQPALLREAERQLLAVAEATKGRDSLVFLGLPVERDGRLYNVAAAVQDGRVLGMVPKANIPSYGEFYEGRYFTAGNRVPVPFEIGGVSVPFGTNLLFFCENVRGLTVACEICEDFWVAEPPGIGHALKGATVIVNLSASSETAGKDEYRELLVKSSSARLICGYVYAAAGEGESTQDLVFGGHNLIAENGTVLAEAKRFQCGTVCGDLDIQRLLSERRRMGTFGKEPTEDYVTVPFRLRQETTNLQRRFSCMPFVPPEGEKRRQRCEEILSIQAYGLKKRLEHTGLSAAVIGISGGLDSTLALLVTVKTFDLLGLERRRITAVTMPCFGTTDRTFENACELAEALGVTLKRIEIREAVGVHFRDIGQDPEKRDVTYENAQARERTQVLMDLANRLDALAIGTGDLSELALGWTTYNGDHMSMYGVNAGVPKTLVRHLVRFYAESCADKRLTEILEDVLDTPVSPELLPPGEDGSGQKTEELVGPYELHDFFLYYMLRCGFPPAKVYRVAVLAFQGQYGEDAILKWLKVFYRRFFGQQFKRSCLPDGPKAGSVSLSPRGDLRMPSDACANLWMEELERLKNWRGS
ncbi:MAG: NAD(+) synthase [Roseburia sp.]|nr:NAD(+) synthase [Roseburia sp.]MCM1098939.1 NAD(+) synthase [Ruminococcus flavefaciens]